MSGDTFCGPCIGVLRGACVYVTRQRSMRKDNVTLFHEALKVTSIVAIVKFDKKVALNHALAYIRLGR